MRDGAVRALADHHVRAERRDFRCRQMSIFVARKIARVSALQKEPPPLQNADTTDLDAEHRRTQNMARLEALHLDPIVPTVLVEVDRFHHFDALLQLLHCVDALSLVVSRSD